LSLRVPSAAPRKGDKGGLRKRQNTNRSGKNLSCIGMEISISRVKLKGGEYDGNEGDPYLNQKGQSGRFLGHGVVQRIHRQTSFQTDHTTP